MTNTPGPPSYPPYAPPPPYSGPPARTSSAATIVTAVLAVLFVAATAVVAVALHDKGDTATVRAAPTSGAAQRPGVPGAASASYSPSLTPTYSPPSITSYVPPPVPTPTRQPLSGETVNRTFQVYMNALLNRSLSQLKLATCPKLRKTETGTALDGRYISRWKGHSYRIYDSLDYVIVGATVRYVDPDTGGNGGTHRYNWYVTRYPDGHYWVCGILG